MPKSCQCPLHFIQHFSKGIVIQHISTDSSLFWSDLRSRHLVLSGMTVFHSSERSVALTSLRRSLDRARRPEGRVLGRPYCKILFLFFSFPSCFSFENASFAARVHFPRCYKREEYYSTQFSQVSPAESVRHDDQKSARRPARWPPAENREKIETRQMRFSSWHLAFS